MINLTLNKLKRPALLNLVPKFGTLVEKNDINKGGLSTAEVDVNMTLPFELMREIEVSSSDTTTKIHYDARVAIVGSDPVTLTLDGATYKGCTVTITNRNTEQATIVLSEDNEKHLESKQSLVLKWDGTAWNDTALVVDSTVSEESHNPVTSAAVYQKANEITEAYTQAIADETNSRGEAIAEEQRLREEAVTAAEQKITEADTRLTQQIEAIEQLHNALVSNAEGFVDSDGDTVTVEDSGKTIRQIAHEEFYRQLITDAADVQTQIDTLKELADYLQTNPSVITDMYSKLGITWSVDNLTDFGTFDFSGVLTATNVDDAVLELYNTFTGKIGELTSLATSAKDNIVAAVNELNTKIGEEVTARTEADTELGTRIDEETSARTQADTELDGKITQLGNHIGQLDSLVTEEKTSAVAAINELHNLIETSSETLTVVCEIEDTAERTAGPSGIVYTQGKIEDIDTLSQQVADNKPVQLILKSKNYMPYSFIALTSYILRPSGIINFSGYIDETQIEDESTSPVRSTNKTCIHVNVDTRTGIVSIEDVDTKDIFINVVFEGEIGTEDVTITKTLSTYDIRLINNFKTGKNASTSAKFSFGGIEVVTGNYDVSDDKIVFTGDTNIGDRLVSYKVIISSESTDNCRLEIGKSATEQLSGVAGEVNTLKESVSELGTEVEALKSAAPGEPVDAYTKAEVDDKFDNVYTKTEVDDKFSEQGGGDSVPNAEAFTYVVDSDEALAAWANATEGNDYTSVLIKKGTWTSSVGVNLTTAGTKAVVGEAGSILSFTNVEKGLYYKEALLAAGYYMTGVTVNIRTDEAYPGTAVCAYTKCCNLINCKCTSTAEPNTANTKIECVAFNACHHLINCAGNATVALVTAADTTVTNCGAVAFNDCQYLTDCTGDAGYTITSLDAAVGTVYYACAGFSSCSNLSNCTGTGEAPHDIATSIGCGLMQCTRVSNCTGTGTGGAFGNGFRECDYLSNCIGTGEGTDSYGFADCTNLSNCEGTGANDNGGGNTATNCEQFSFVVDSNEKLAAWANATEGNDYTSVLIRKGEWTSTVGVNLTAAGTKVVVGAAGSKLVFNNVEKGLYYNLVTHPDNYQNDYMQGVTVEVKVSSYSSIENCYGFHSCGNLYNCASAAADATVAYGFHSCKNLSNCRASGRGVDSGYGFHSCTNISNCNGIGSSDYYGDVVGAGFYNCENLSICTGSGIGSGYGFHSCKIVIGCTGTGEAEGGTDPRANGGFGYYDCSNLVSCKGEGKVTEAGHSKISDNFSFYKCSNLYNCEDSTFSDFEDIYIKRAIIDTLQDWYDSGTWGTD